MSLLTSIYFCVLILIFSPLVAKYLAENGVSELFEKLKAQFSFFMKNFHLCNTRLQNRNLNWIFLDEVGSDQSGGILSPFMGTACLCLSSWMWFISQSSLPQDPFLRTFMDACHPVGNKCLESCLILDVTQD